MIKDTILVYKGGQWCWDGIDEIPAYLGPWMAKIKIGTGWSDKEVSVFVTDFVSQFLENDVDAEIVGYTSCMPCNGSGCDRCMPHLYEEYD